MVQIQIPIGKIIFLIVIIASGYYAYRHWPNVVTMVYLGEQTSRTHNNADGAKFIQSREFRIKLEWNH